MKKILLTILAVLAMSGMAMAQTAPSDINLHRNEDGSWSFIMPGRNLVMSTETFSTNDTVNGHYLAGVPEGWLILALGDTVPVSNDSLRRTTPITEGTPVTIVPTGNLRRIKSITLVDELPPAVPLDNTSTAWADGSRLAVPAGGLTYSDAITVSGDVTLVLTDGETLTLNKGISLAEGATLTVEGEGTMTVNGTNGSTASTVAGSGTLVLTSGTLNATGGNGADAVGTGSNITANAGGVAINGAVTVSGGTLTATGGNGGSITGQFRMNCKGGAGGAAISGALTINGGTVTTTNGTNGSVGSGCFDCTAGAGGAAAAGGVTDNR